MRRSAKSNNESGNVLFLLLLAVGLFAALSYTFTQDSGGGDSAQAQKSFMNEKELEAQISQIQSGIQQCNLLYTQINLSSANLTNTADIDYPLATDDFSYPSSPPSPLPESLPDADTEPNPAFMTPLDELVCPGTYDSGSGTVERVFDGVDGRFLPNPPTGFDPWTFTNYDPSSDGIYVQITANIKEGEEALSRIATSTSSCEARLNFNSCGNNCLTYWFVSEPGC